MKEGLLDTIVIGAGQAGLAMGYFLKKSNRTFLLLDKNKRIGDSWRNRYDSLILFTPRSHSALPGLQLLGDKHGYPTKDELADYLENYSNQFDIPVKLKTSVKSLSKIDGIFHVLTENSELYKAKNIVVASGPFQQPFYPKFSKEIPDEVFQIHAADYRNPGQLNEGSTVVVGGGNSGMQIAVELSPDREVYLSLGKKPKYLSYEILGKSIFWWFGVLGISKLTIDSKLGQLLKRNDPIIGTESKALIKSKRIKLLPRATGFKEDKMIFGNQSFKPNNIIWATGYRPDYQWIHIPHIFDTYGNPIHNRGVTSEPGLYFLGLSWQYRRGSALLLGVGDDAKYLVHQIDGN